MEEKDRYIYFHRKPVSNEVFYVGIGKRQPKKTFRGIYKRAFDKGRNNLWEKIVNKYNYVVTIEIDNLSFEEACILETRFIRSYGRLDIETGTLANLTDGGEGIKNVTKEAKEKIKKSKLGKKHITEAINKMKIANKGRKNWQKGKNVSEKTKEKLRYITNSPFFIHPLSKAVINVENGEIFKSIGQAAKSIGISENTLSRYLNGKRKNKTPFKFINDTTQTISSRSL